MIVIRGREVKNSGHSGRAQEGGSPAVHTPTRQPWLAEGRGVWLALILAPILAWAALLLTVYTTVPPRASTGDPLLDKLVRTITASTSDPALTGWGMATNSTDIDETIRAEWEAEFGDDPHYWTLGYHLTGYSAESFTSEFAGVDLGPRVRYLEEARRRGAVDGAVLLRLLREYDSAWKQQAYPSVGVSPPQRDESKVPYVRALRAVIDQQHGEAHQQLVDELLAAAPDQALAHYHVAIYEAERGDYEAAVAELRAGNRAAHVSTLTGFPFDELRHDMRAGEPLEDKLASGRLCHLSISVPMPSFIVVKDMVKLLIAEAIERQDLAALDELHTFACRYCAAEGADMIQALVGCVMIALPLNAVRDQWPEPLSAEARKALDEFEAKKDQLKAEIRGLSSNSFWNVYGQMPPRQYWLSYAESLLTGGGSFSLIYLEMLHDDTLREQQGLAGKVKQLVDEIETFDYTTLSWEQ